MTTRDFSHVVALAKLSPRPQPHHLVAGEAARAALAARFGLQSIGRLEAWLDVSRSRDGAALTGRMVADVVQTCVVSGEPVPAHVEEDLALRFEPADESGEELELESDALDVLPTDGDAIDLGEAVAQSLALALDPWPRAPDEVVEQARRHLTTEAEAEAQAEADKKAANPFSKLRPQ
jgi:uncharacterized metal-binding protein YceD (DUF177 family)